MKLNTAYFNLFLYDLTAVATIVGVYVIARLLEMPLKGVANKWVRIITAALLALIGVVIVIVCLVWVWYNFGLV